MVEKPFSLTRKDIVKLFEKHCKDGWSPFSFSSKIQKAGKGYYFLMDTNPEFKAIAHKYTKKTGKLSFYPTFGE